MAIRHFCHECGEELQDGEETCAAHPDAHIDSIEVENSTDEA